MTYLNANNLLTIINFLPIGVVSFSSEGEIRFFNDFVKQNMANNKEYSRFKSIDALFENQKDIVYIIIKFIENKEQKSQQVSYVFDGLLLNLHLYQIADDYLLIIEDITHHKELESNAINSIFEGQEQEKKRIAKEIHDGIGPLLSSIKLNLQNLSNEIHFSSEQLVEFNDITQLIDNVTDDLRALSHALMPKILEDFGLVAAIENQISKWSSKKRDLITFYQTIDNERFDRMIELNLYRIFQELLNNAFKHSDADSIHIQLIKHPSSIVLMVEDNGVGFDYLEKIKFPKGMGLLNIDSRTKAINGILTFDSSSKNGVTCIIEIPI